MNASRTESGNRNVIGNVMVYARSFQRTRAEGWGLDVHFISMRYRPWHIMADGALW